MALPYFEYFGRNAGEPGRGYYSYELGAWHIIVLNSNCSEVGGCEPDSQQGRWLASVLKSGHRCTLAYWHHPVLTIGPHENDEAGMMDLWRMLHQAGVDVVVNGHEHDYQRYLPLNASADAVDPTGIRLFVVGTGGTGLSEADPGRAGAAPGLEVWADERGNGHAGSHGVITFRLGDGSYEWEFVPVPGGSFRDSGADRCR
jgi:hypothetical protein